MTTEQNQPQPPAENAPQAQASNQSQGQQPGHGGHRRRRRRKRNKGGSPAQAQGQPQQGPPQNQQPPQAQKPKHKQQQPPSSQQRFFRNGNGQQGGGGGGRRRNKPRRERVFVGPMDHSYRAVNGNVADGPPSHMEYRNGNINGNGNGNGYHNESASRDAQPPPVREDAPTRIYLFIEDLFFFAKINETARKLGIKVAFVKNDAETLAKIYESAEAEKPSLIVFDLNNAAAKPMTLIPKLKSKLKKGTSIIGFLSHLQGDLKAKAVEAGCDIVMPRSAFSQNLPTLLRRHGIDEEQEVEYAQA
jgi:hypothetical protein